MKNWLIGLLAILPAPAMAQDYLAVPADPQGGSGTYYLQQPNGDVLAVPVDPQGGAGTYYYALPGGQDSPMPGTTPNGEATCDPGMCAGQ